MLENLNTHFVFEILVQNQLITLDSPAKDYLVSQLVIKPTGEWASVDDETDGFHDDVLHYDGER